MRENERSPREDSDESTPASRALTKRRQATALHIWRCQFRELETSV
jgi:hypothetical protein